MTRSTLNILSQWITRRAAAGAGGGREEEGAIAQMDTLANKLHLMGEHFTAMTATTTRSRDETRYGKTRDEAGRGESEALRIRREKAQKKHTQNARGMQ